MPSSRRAVGGTTPPGSPTPTRGGWVAGRTERDPPGGARASSWPSRVGTQARGRGRGLRGRTTHSLWREVSTTRVGDAVQAPPASLRRGQRGSGAAGRSAMSGATTPNRQCHAWPRRAARGACCPRPRTGSAVQRAPHPPAERTAPPSALRWGAQTAGGATARFPQAPPKPEG